jgi:DNA-binding NtrC family response regulator
MKPKAHILIVDDDNAFRLSLHKMLTAMGFSVFTARSAVEALALLRVQSMQLVFSDMKMPKMTGLELLKEIKQHYPETPVVLVTAYNQTTAGVDALESMASGFLNKPVKRHEIVEVLKTFLDFDADEMKKQ